MRKNASIWGIAALNLLNFARLDAASGSYQDFNLRLTAMENKMAPDILLPEKKSHFFSAIEVFIWQAAENGLPIAIKTKNPVPLDFGTFLGTVADGKVKNIKFDWSPGFRVATGYRWQHELDLSLTWLRFFTKGHRHLHAGSGEQLAPSQLHPVDGVGNLLGETSVADGYNGLYFTKAHAHWYAHLNQLDLDLCRSFHVGKWLGLSPHGGLRTTWLQQRLSANYGDEIGLGNNSYTFDFNIPGDDYDVRKKDSWWGIGPEVGLGIRLGFGKGWSLATDVTGSIEFGYQHLKEKDIDTTIAQSGGNGLLVDFSDHFQRFSPILDFQLGLGWDHHFKDSCCTLRLQGAWELHVYYTQNQFPFFYNADANSSNVGQFTTNQGDLSYQGWKLAAQVDF